MNVDTFLQRFRVISRAPNGVSKLRELVLQLAVTGRLFVKSKPESLDGLLSQIESERARLIEAGELSSGRSIPDVESASQHTKVPKHWHWMRLGNLTSKIGSGSTPRGGAKVYVSTGVAFLRSQNVWNDGVKLDDVVYIAESTHERMKNTRVIANDILLNITGASLGRCAKTPGDFPEANVSQHVTIIRPLLPELRHFLHICLLSPMGQSMIWGRQVGMAREGLSKKVLEQFEIPLPPLAEQQRIVAKVDELMGLCDRLESQLAERAKLLPLLSRANHARFTASPSLQNLSAVFHEKGSSSHDDLRRTILSLAFRGSLRRCGEESLTGQALLEQANVEKEVAYESGRVKRQKRLSRDAIQPPLQDLPENWVSCLIDDIAFKVTDGEHLTPKRESKGHILLSARNIRDGYIDLSNIDYVGDEEFSRIRARCDPDKDDILLSCSGSVGRVAIVDESHKYVMVRSAALIKPVQTCIRPKFLMFQLQSPELQQQILQSSKQSAQANLFIDPIRRLVVVVPPLPDQDAIVSMIEHLFSMTDNVASKKIAADRLAETLASLFTKSITEDKSPEIKIMKPPKTTVVASLKANRQPNESDAAPLAKLLSGQPGSTTPRKLWEISGLEIDRFYAQLKTEIANGWIADPEPANVREVEVG